MKRPQLKGTLESPSGQAPQDAFTSVGGDLRRPQDLWMVGHPSDLLRDPTDWKQKLRERLVAPEAGPLGLRLRFVVRTPSELKTDLVGLVGTLLEVLPDAGTELFLNAELMTGPEEGIYLAYDNRPPALLTQLWLAHRDEEPVGKFPAIDGPLHLNLILHDEGVGFREAWNDGTLGYALDRLRGISPQSLLEGNLHQLTLARSDLRSHGISLGAEGIVSDEGSQGGSSAADLDNRASLPIEHLKEEASLHQGPDGGQLSL